MLDPEAALYFMINTNINIYRKRWIDVKKSMIVVILILFALFVFLIIKAMELTDVNKNINPVPPPIEKSPATVNSPETDKTEKTKETDSLQQITTNVPQYAPQLDVILLSDDSQEQTIKSIQLKTVWNTDFAGDNNNETDSPVALQLSSQDFNDATFRLNAKCDLILLHFRDDYPPDSVSVNRWHSIHGYLNDRFSGVSPDNYNTYISNALDSIKPDTIDAAGNILHIENDGNDYIYEVHAQWENGESYYTFRTIDSDINIFWTEFREAVINMDYETITEFVNFPAETRGALDSDPIIKISIEEFETTFTKYLSGYDSTQYPTNYDYIDQNPYLTFYEHDSARTGNMYLKKINGTWKITFFYIV